MTVTRKRWTELEIERLVSAAVAGASAAETAEALGRSTEAVRQQGRKSGVYFRDTHGSQRTVWTPERIEWLSEELETKPVTQVSSESGISVSSITGAIKSYDIKRMIRQRAPRSSLDWRSRMMETTRRKFEDSQ